MFTAIKKFFNRYQVIRLSDNKTIYSGLFRFKATSALNQSQSEDFRNGRKYKVGEAYQTVVPQGKEPLPELQIRKFNLVQDDNGTRLETGRVTLHPGQHVLFELPFKKGSSNGL